MQLSDIVDGVRAEVGHSMSRAVALNDNEALRNQINRTENWLWNQHEWPQHRVYRDEALQAGENVYTFHRDLNPNRIDSAWCSDGTEWTQVVYSVNPADYMVFETTFPVLKWQHFHGEQRNSSPQYEVWPRPDRTGESLRFYGVRNLLKMTNEGDHSTLDGELIVAFTAARIGTRQQFADAQLLVQSAESYLFKLRAQLASSQEAFVLGGGGGHHHLRPGIDYVRRSTR